MNIDDLEFFKEKSTWCLHRVIRSNPIQPSRSSNYDPRTFYHELNVILNVQDVLQPLKMRFCQLRNEPLNQITT